MPTKSLFRTTLAALLMGAAAWGAVAQAASPEKLNDLEIAHVAYTADNIDIRYAHLALAKSSNPAVRQFAETMIRDHTAVNAAALELVAQLNVAPQDNFLSQDLNKQADQLIIEMSHLSGSDFDKRYAENELAYHQAVNGLIEGVFIPNIETPQVKLLFEEALVTFKGHQNHADMLVKAVQ